MGFKCEVHANDQITIEEIRSNRPDKIIVSPGPGSPSDAGVSNAVIENFHKSVPILGVCLGHQCVGLNFGAKLVHAPRIMHGKVSKISYSESRIFQGMSRDFAAARYHSLAIDGIRSPLRITAIAEDGTIMAIEHESYPVYGVQFHPESFLTASGEKIIENFLR